MRDVKELSEEIDRFTLESSICREVKYTAAELPALERENEADLERLKSLAADSAEAQYLRDETICVRTRLIGRLREQKDLVITETRHEIVPQDKGISALGAHIRATWTIREVLFFKSFTHGGSFSAPNGEWCIDYAGYVSATADGMRNLVRLFDSLHAEIWAYMGARLYVDMKPGMPSAALTHGDIDAYMELTLGELMQALPAKSE